MPPFPTSSFWLKSGSTLVILIAYMIGFSQNNGNDPSISEEAYIGRVYEITPEENINEWSSSLLPGDQLILHEGIYKGNILFNVSGVQDFPIVIRGYGNGESRPVLLFEGVSGETMKIAGDHVVLDYLEFRSAETYCIRIGDRGRGANDVTIRNTVFQECGGGDISANYNGVPYDNIKILDNYFLGSKRTPVYIGNHSGTTTVTHFLFKGNVIDGSQNDGPEATIGYGIELKLNVTKSVVENNFITGTKGPGIMVYGATGMDPYDSNVVRNNIIINARHEAGIVVGGGPSVIVDNIVISSNWGIYVQNYGNRDLLEHIVINRNTLLNNDNFGLSFQNNEKIMASQNVVFTRTDAPAFVETPGLSDDNKTILLSQNLTKETHSVMNIIPEKRNLSNIWQYSSGPLTEPQLLKLMELIKDHSIPTTVQY